MNANSEGDCELRLRGIVDRETVDRYTLNVSVSAPGTNGKGLRFLVPCGYKASLLAGRTSTDYAQILVDVADVNDNAPRFLFDESMSAYRTYFAALAAEQPAGSHVVTVQVWEDV